ncbi:UNVERIFIED_CONTAM: hypothetical protein FKN15_036898 [Acipenser sinensis]
MVMLASTALGWLPPAQAGFHGPGDIFHHPGPSSTCPGRVPRPRGQLPPPWAIFHLPRQSSTTPGTTSTALGHLPPAQAEFHDPGDNFHRPGPSSTCPGRVPRPRGQLPPPWAIFHLPMQSSMTLGTTSTALGHLPTDEPIPGLPALHKEKRTLPGAPAGFSGIGCVTALDSGILVCERTPPGDAMQSGHTEDSPAPSTLAPGARGVPCSPTAVSPHPPNPTWEEEQEEEGEDREGAGAAPVFSLGPGKRCFAVGGFYAPGLGRSHLPSRAALSQSGAGRGVPPRR